MKPRTLKDGVYWVGAIDWDRRLFDELIPLPDGTSYNAYLLIGNGGTALIDTVDPTMAKFLVDNLRELNIKHLDYIIVNHAEQDHSGTLPIILNLYPEAKVIATPRCKDMLIDLLLIPGDRVQTVSDGEKLSLGDKTLEFIHFPWVHWPETMLTYLREDAILFSCDLFGSHLATSNLYAVDEAIVFEAAKRYYAEIMMPFRLVIQRNMEKIRSLEINMIAPSHGPVYRKPNFILEAYRDWVYNPPKNLVVLPYVSMHGSTKAMVDYLVSALIDRGVGVQQFNLPKADIGKLAMALVDAATVVIGSPTVLGGPHPAAVYAAHLISALKPKIMFATIIGSYGWGTTIAQQISQILSPLKAEFLEPVLVKGYPREDTFKALDRLADEILEKHRKHGLA
ncbi:MAG: FprA family A-type flavoprotein [Candidatus Bathyarchaeia archaeon]|nr:FprA family A-type flavoprotein [Candidatus Bathyarchaeota archaeon]